jgi:hypothetical protein
VIESAGVTKDAYIKVLSGKVVALQPAGESAGALLDSAEYDIVLNRLVEAGWELVNPSFKPTPSGQSLIRIKQEASYSETRASDNVRVATVEVSATPGDFDGSVLI